MHYFDILIFALIALFLGLRLRGILGSRTGEERPPSDPYSPPNEKAEEGKVVRFPGQSPSEPARDAEFEEVGPAKSEPAAIDFVSFGTAGLGLEAIHKADPSFEPGPFLTGAKAAFEMIVTAFAGGDSKTLKNLLAPHVFKDFQGVIEQRAKDGQTLECQLVGVTRQIIEAARLDGSEAYVTVRFESEQVNALKDKSGAVIEGDANRVERVIDVWTFMRDTRNKNPNWYLVETLTPE